jgi:hypothetical protein
MYFYNITNQYIRSTPLSNVHNPTKPVSEYDELSVSIETSRSSSNSTTGIGKSLNQTAQDSSQENYNSMNSLEMIGNTNMINNNSFLPSKKLYHVNVAGCSNLIDSNVSYIFQCYPNLRTLNVSSCKNVSLLNVVLNDNQHLVDIQANYCTVSSNDISLLNDKNVKINESLQSLSLDGCLINDHDFLFICKNVVNLKYLSIRWCVNLTLNGIRNGIRFLKFLEIIDVTDLGMEAQLSTEFCERDLFVKCQKWLPTDDGAKVQ